MPKEKETTLLLNDRQIRHKITRIAHEIQEQHYLEKELILVGIEGRGVLLTSHIAEALRAASDQQITEYVLSLDKMKPLARPIEFSGDLRKIKGKSVVIIDDVINSGKTLMYGAMHLLHAEPRSLTTACLVDRFHRTFPIRSDFAGLTLSTNLKEHIHVDYQRNKWSVSLQ